MAKFDVSPTTKSLPGKGLGALADVDTRMGDLAAAFAEFGGALADVGITDWKLQADTELSDAIQADEEAMNDMFIRLEGNTDPHTYDEEYRKVADVNQNREFKNGLAARAHTNYIKRNIPKWKLAVTLAKKARIKDNGLANLFEARQAAIKEGRIAPYYVQIKSLVKAGYMSEKEAATQLYNTRYEMEKFAARQLLMRDPNGFIDSVKGEKAGGFVLLTPGDVQRLRNDAVNQKHYLENQANGAKESAYKKIHSAAIRNEWSPAEAAIKIEEMTELNTKEQQTTLFNYAATTRLISQGKGNPFTTTQNWPKYKETLEKIEVNPESVSYNEISAGWGAFWGWNERQNLMRAKYPDQQDDSLKTAYAKEWLLHIDSLFIKDPKKKDIPRELMEVWGKTRNQIESILKRYPTDFAKSTAEIEKVLAPIKKKRAKNLVFQMMRYSPIGQYYRWGGKKALSLIKKPPVHIDTLEEIQRLPSGTEFEYQGDNYTRD